MLPHVCEKYFITCRYIENDVLKSNSTRLFLIMINMQIYLCPIEEHMIDTSYDFYLRRDNPDHSGGKILTPSVIPQFSLQTPHLRYVMCIQIEEVHTNVGTASSTSCCPCRVRCPELRVKASDRVCTCAVFIHRHAEHQPSTPRPDEAHGFSA